MASSESTTPATTASARTRHFKLVLLGDSSVGKSCLVAQFVRGEFHDFQEPTIGAAFLTATIALDDTSSSSVRLEIWDTAGQERYRSLAPMYYRGAAAAIVVFDLTSQESFTGAKSWVKELQRRGDANVVIALAGNKLDVDGRVVEKEEATAFAEENGIIYMETSAKTAHNVRELFVAVARRLPKNEVVTEGAGAVPLVATKEVSGGCC